MTTMAPERAAYSRMVLDHILANPDLHDQSAFEREVFCGTAHCIAGWAVELDADSEITWSGSEAGDLSWRLRVNGHADSPVARAADLLGLPYEYAVKLFYEATDNGEAIDLLRSWIEEAEAAA